jgi:hypothetical protein
MKFYVVTIIWYEVEFHLGIQLNQEEFLRFFVLLSDISETIF